MQIKQINKNQLEECLEVIHKSFATVAKQFDFTQENCPGHTSFMPLEKLQRFYDWGFLMYGLFDDINSKNQDKICGFISLSKVPERDAAQVFASPVTTGTPAGITVLAMVSGYAAAVLSVGI